MEEVDALISPAVSEETVVTVKKELDEETQKRAPGKRKWIVLLTVLILVAAGISIFFYLQNRPKPVPTPKSVDLPMQTSSTTSEMPETAFRISPEKQQHRADFNRDVDDCEHRCLKEMRGRLNQLGIYEGKWRSNAEKTVVPI